MFQTVHPDDIFDLKRAQHPETHPAYWLAQLRKADWRRLLEFINLSLPVKAKKQAMAEAALQHFEFVTCLERGDVWQIWLDGRPEQGRGLVIQFRHAETDWSRGRPEFVDLEKNEPLGVVNIAGRLFCKAR